MNLGSHHFTPPRAEFNTSPDSFLIAAPRPAQPSLPDNDYAFFAAFANRHRFFVAAMILFIPSGLILRFALVVSAW
jgi:hypothetical protein